MRLRKTLMTLTLGGAFAFMMSAPGAFAQNANPGPMNSLIAPNNDAGSGGSHAPGTKYSGPFQPANPMPGNGSANDVGAVPSTTANDANPRTFSSSTLPMTANPDNPEGQGPAGAQNAVPGQ